MDSKVPPFPRARSSSDPHFLIRRPAPYMLPLPPVLVMRFPAPVPSPTLPTLPPLHTTTGAATAGGQAGTQRLQRLRSDQVPGAQEERLAAHLLHRLRPGERSPGSARPPAPPRPAPPRPPSTCPAHAGTGWMQARHATMEVLHWGDAFADGRVPPRESARAPPWGGRGGAGRDVLLR